MLNLHALLFWHIAKCLRFLITSNWYVFCPTSVEIFTSIWRDSGFFTFVRFWIFRGLPGTFHLFLFDFILFNLWNYFLFAFRNCWRGKALLLLRKSECIWQLRLIVFGFVKVALKIQRHRSTSNCLWRKGLISAHILNTLSGAFEGAPICLRISRTITELLPTYLLCLHFFVSYSLLSVNFSLNTLVFHFL